MSFQRRRRDCGERCSRGRCRKGLHARANDLIRIRRNERKYLGRARHNSVRGITLSRIIRTTANITIKLWRTSRSSPGFHSLPSLSNALLFREKPRRFSSSYAMNCKAPLLTPTSARSVPRHRPRTPSFEYTSRKPSNEAEVSQTLEYNHR